MKELKRFLVDYFIQHPGTNEQDVLEIAAQAKREAKIKNLPQYHPLDVEDQSHVDDYYNETHTVQKRVVRKDESTHLGYKKTEYE